MRSSVLGLLGLCLGSLLGCNESPPQRMTPIVDTASPANLTPDSAPVAAVVNSEGQALLRMDSLVDSLHKVEQAAVTAKAGIQTDYRGLSSDLALENLDSSRGHLARRMESIDSMSVECTGIAADTSWSVIELNGDYFVAGEFYFGSAKMAFANGLHAGMTPGQVEKLLGKPYRRLPGMLSYWVGEMGENADGGENLFLFFQSGKLTIVHQVPRQQDC